MPEYDIAPLAMTLRDPNAPRSELKESEQISNNEDDALIKEIMELYDQAKTARSNRDQDWQRRVEFYQDNQWDRLRAAYKAKPVLNVIRTTIQAIIPILTDNRPGINAIPSEPKDFKLAQILNKLIENWWNDSEVAMDHTLVEVLTDDMLYDAGILKIVWDEDMGNGKGDMKATVPCPEDIYVPFGARDFGKDCPYVIERMVKTVGYLRRKFPEKAHLIKADGALTSAGTDKTVDKSVVTLVSPTDRKAFNVPQGQDSKGGDSRKTCEVWEVWMDCDETEEIQLEKLDDKGEHTLDENGQPQMETRQKLKYPQGRLVTILPNQKLKLQAIPNPYKHGGYPYIRFIDYIFPRSFWGEGETKAMMPQQRIINKILGNMIDYANLMANPVWITELNNGVDPDRLTNQVGSVIQTEAGKLETIKRDIPPAQTPGSTDLLGMLVRQTEMISGQNEITQGRKPAGITAAQAIDSLAEAGQTRIRLKERNMNVSIAQMGKMLISLMMQYYKTPRVIAIDSQKGQEWPDYFEFFTEDLPDGTTKWNHQEYIQGPDGPVPSGQYQSGTTKSIFSIKVLSGTSLPFAKTQRSNVAFKLFDSQVIDAKELLDTLEWPNSEEILARKNEEAGAAGAAPPPPPPKAQDTPEELEKDRAMKKEIAALQAEKDIEIARLKYTLEMENIPGMLQAELQKFSAGFKPAAPTPPAPPAQGAPQ